MEICRTALGERHPYYATSLNNLAGLYYAMGRHAEAEPLYKQAMEIRRTALGERHPDYATSLNNLDVHFATRSSVLIDLDYSGSLWERSSSCTKITLGPQAHGCLPCRCLSRTLFVCPIHSVPNSRP